MSPIAYALMKLLRGGVLAAAAFLGLVLGLEAWKHDWDVSALNPGFTIVVGLLLAGALWLARSISRELARHGSEHGP
jgi:apolipoprotein N-acyltransferase